MVGTIPELFIIWGDKNKKCVEQVPAGIFILFLRAIVPDPASLKISARFIDEDVVSVIRGANGSSGMTSPGLAIGVHGARISWNHILE